MPDSYSIAIIDDDDAVRDSTAGLLRGAGHRVDSFAGGAEFLAWTFPPGLCCILLDMRMPGMDGLAVMRALGQRDWLPPILVLTGHGDVATAVEAIRLGAVDFLEKPYPPATLLDAIHLACTIPVPALRGQPVDPEARAKVATLTERQHSVLACILRGRPNKIIAWELGLSIRTVEAYRAQTLLKLGVRGTAQAVRMALAAGMTALESQPA